MAQINFDFSCLKDHYSGLLSPEDVFLFYYDIGIDVETGNSVIYNWDHDVEKYLADNKIVIDDCNMDEIPCQVSENQIFFSLCKEDESNKAISFFRHLRNAFSHYHIGLSGDFYNIKDTLSDGKTVTMIGKIHRDAFKCLLEVFYKQKSKAEDDSFYLYNIN